MKTKNKMNRRIKIMFKILFYLFISVGYGQKGFYVDKDYRIKKYQSDMIKFLIDDKWLEKKEKGEIIITNGTYPFNGILYLVKY